MEVANYTTTSGHEKPELPKSGYASIDAEGFERTSIVAHSWSLSKDGTTFSDFEYDSDSTSVVKDWIGTADQLYMSQYLSKTRERNRRLKQELYSRYSKSPSVRSVFFQIHEEEVEVTAIVEQGNRELLERLFDIELELYQTFPELTLDFRIAYTNDDGELESSDLPEDAVVCFIR